MPNILSMGVPILQFRGADPRHQEERLLSHTSIQRSLEQRDVPG